MIHPHVVPEDFCLLQTHLVVVGWVDVLIHTHYFFSALIEVEERI